MFKVYAIQCVQEIVKDKMSIVVNNSKLNIFNSKISPNIMKRFFILIIDNKYAKSALILQFLFKISTNNIDIFSHFFW